MDELDKYLVRFRVGQTMGIDIPGEMPGRLPSPENKIKLANTTSPWLDPIWYPEGDSCNSVIGQGITLVTPLQLVNWASTIANGGILMTPHVGKSLVDVNGDERELTFQPIDKLDFDPQALKLVQDGMRLSVGGARRVIYPLTDAKVHVAGKTGTAEFGIKDSNGVYEHTHAWVIGFFPYENPQYAFVVFLEDGGASNNSAYVVKQVIDFMVDNGLVE
jgi:penicillin-binding protein 2